MASIYLSGGIWYAPPWKNPLTGETRRAHSLGVKGAESRSRAEALWVIEQAELVTAAGGAPAAGVERPAPLLLSELLARYLEFKGPALAPATVLAYEGAGRQVIATLGDRALPELEGERGGQVLGNWARAEIERLGRSHSVCKRVEGLLRPALRFGHEMGWLRQLPPVPRIRSDYYAFGRRDVFLTPEQFRALVAELPDVDEIRHVSGAVVRVYPRLWAEIAVTTGMHDSDLSRFCGRDWDRVANLWRRRNAKAGARERERWFPAGPVLRHALERAASWRAVGPDTLWVADAPPGTQWMRHRLRWAARRAGLAFTPQPIDFRRTFATWKRDAGWQADETAAVLGNSSVMVRDIYAKIGLERFEALERQARPAMNDLLRGLREDIRRGPARVGVTAAANRRRRAS